MPKKCRADQLLVDRGLAANRSRARALILAGKLRTPDGAILDKPGQSLPVDAAVELEAPPPYVGRGGEKLAAALDHFGIPVQGCRILDVGASTGGFTDCCLQRGAIAVTCVDVGRAQLHGKLLADPRVTNLERVNARYLQPGDLPHPAYPRIVMDLSFISLTKVLPAVWPCLEPAGRLVALVKPQFEADKADTDKARGVIRDPAIRESTLNKVRRFVETDLPGAEVLGWMDSPIAGGDGNREYLLAIRKVP
ncbi:MAG: TlyA family RNA methyltransferase [Opitutales bacterium]